MKLNWMMIKRLALTVVGAAGIAACAEAPSDDGVSVRGSANTAGVSEIATCDPTVDPCASECFVNGLAPAQCCAVDGVCQRSGCEFDADCDCKADDECLSEAACTLAGLPDPDCGGGDDCTYTQGWWKTHHQNASGSKKIDWPAPEDENAKICGRTWLSILKTSTQGRAWYILAHQWISAKLNVANGASTTAAVDNALDKGNTLLLNNCNGIKQCDRSTALGYADTLDDYNNGYIGPGHCDEGGGGGWGGGGCGNH